MAVNLDVPRGSRFEADHGGSRRWSRSSFDRDSSRREDGDDEQELRRGPPPMQSPNAVLSGSDASGDMHGDRFLRRCISQMHSAAQRNLRSI